MRRTPSAQDGSWEAFFRCIDRPGHHHRIYKGPPDGTPHVRLGPDEVPIYFSKPYRIKAMFANETFSSVQFEVPQTHSDGSTLYIKVWANIRRQGDWWAEILDSSTVEELGELPHDFLCVCLFSADCLGRTHSWLCSPAISQPLMHKLGHA